MRAILLLLILFLASSPQMNAEIEKTALVCDTGICMYWWPKLESPKGWHQDQDTSYQIEANAQIPDGFTFSNAETIMYAKALYKPRIPETKSVDALIADDKKEFLLEKPDMVIAESDAMTTADGKKLRSFTFFPKNAGDYEQVAYGEEGDFYLIFTISAKSKRGFDATERTFKELVSHYKE